jgi:membrane protein
MKLTHRPDLNSTLSSVLRLAVAVVSVLEIARSAKLTARPTSPQARGRKVVSTLQTSGAPRGAAQGAETQQAERKKQHDATALHNESRPKALFHIAISAAKQWSAHRAASKGAALALYTLFSLAPMLLLVVMIAGAFLGEETVRETLVEQLSGLMGEQAGEGVRTILGGAQLDSSGLLPGLVSAGLVLISATSAFAELKDSLDELWEVPPSTRSGIFTLLRERVLSFGLILVVALMLLTSLSISAALDAMAGIWTAEEGSPLKVVITALSHLASFAIVTLLFAIIFKYLPATKIAWKDVFVGSLITAILFIVGKSLIDIYIASADISSGYGAAGSIVILITWVYYSAQIFFYGALFTHEYAIKLGSRTKAVVQK